MRRNHSILLLSATTLLVALPSAAIAQTQTGATESLVANSGFEAGAESPENWKAGPAITGIDYVWERQLAHTGKASLCLRKTAPDYMRIGQWSQAIDRTGNSSHLQVDCWVKAQKTNKAV